MNSLKGALMRWPPIIWPLMTFKSLLILVGSSSRLDSPLVVCGLSLYLALNRWSDRARPAIMIWAIAGVVVFYVLVGLAGSAAAVEYGLVGVAAGVIPLSAVALCRRRCVRAPRSPVVDWETTRAIRTRIRLRVWEWTIRPRWAIPPDHSDNFDQPDVTPSGRWEHPAANQPGTQAHSTLR
jgi:hypothetical protein